MEKKRNLHKTAMKKKERRIERKREKKKKKGDSVGGRLRPAENIKIRSRKVQASLTASSKNIC